MPDEIKSAQKRSKTELNFGFKTELNFGFKKRSKPELNFGFKNGPNLGPPRKSARELPRIAFTETMGGGTAGEAAASTPPSGPPELPAVLSFQEVQEVRPPLRIHPTSHLHAHARHNRRSWSSAPDFRGYVGWSSAPPHTSSYLRVYPQRVCRLELCSPAYLT